MATRRLPCTCKHRFQDERYGPGVRVHNQAKDKNGNPAWRCTVCGDVKRGGQVLADEWKEKP